MYRTEHSRKKLGEKRFVYIEDAVEFNEEVLSLSDILRKVSSQKLTKEILLKSLIDLISELGRFPIYSELEYTSSTYLKYFSKTFRALLWENISSLTFQIRTRDFPELSNDELLDFYIEKSNELRRLDNLKDIKNDKFMPSTVRYINAFGSILLIKELARNRVDFTVNENIEPKRKYSKRKTDEVLISEYLNLSNKLGRFAAPSDVRNSPEMSSYNIYSDRFGGINNLRRMIADSVTFEFDPEKLK